MARKEKEQPEEGPKKEGSRRRKDLASMSKEELIALVEELEEERLRLLSEREQLEACVMDAFEKMAKWEKEFERLEGRSTELAERVEAAEKKMEELSRHYQQLMENLERLKERAERKVREAYLTGALEIVVDLLPVLDNLERATKAMKEAKDVEALKRGVEMTYKMLFQTLEAKGLKRIKSQGEEFDPEVHECTERVETEEVKEGTIVGEELPGYMFRGRLLRAAKVKVAVKPPEKGEKEKRGQKKSN